MKTFKLGQKFEINRFGYGAMRLTGPGIIGDVKDRPAAIKLLQSAVDSGINFIDTADSYGPHTNEVLIAEAFFKNKPKDLIIATKGGLERPGPDQWQVNGDPKYIKKAIDDSLVRLKTDTIDLWQLHRIDPRFPLEETLEPVKKAFDAGKIKMFGLSEAGIKEIERAQKILPVTSVQNIYNIGNRQWEEVLNYTHKHNIAFIPWYPMGANPNSLPNQLEAIAKKHKVTKAQVALAWLYNRSENILLIPGTSSEKHLHENIESLKIDLDSFDEASLKDIN